MNDNLYVSDKYLAKRYRVGRSTIWRWTANEQMPKPRKLSPGCSRWKMTDIIKWEREEN